MHINPFAMAVGLANTGSSSAARNSTQSSSASSPAQDTKNMFLTLLTAQLKNQTPLDPVDPMQFTTELVQFNMLDQLTQINNVLQFLSGGIVSPSGHSSVATPGGK